MTEKKQITKAQQKAVAKYSKENYDEIKVRVPKGKKEIVQVHADKKDKSLNSFINRAIDETILRESTSKEGEESAD